MRRRHTQYPVFIDYLVPAVILLLWLIGGGR